MNPSALLLVVACLAAGCDEPEFQAPPPPPVVVSEPRVEDVVEYEVLSGRTSPFETVEVRARVQGVLLEIVHREGGRVEEGELMFQIDPEPFIAARDAAAAQVSAAEAQAELKDITATKLEAAYEDRAVSELQALEARASHRVALQEVEVAQKNLAIRQLDVSYTDVTAPIPGKVEYSDYYEGSLVGGFDSSALTRVVDDSKVRVWFSMPDRTALRFIGSSAAQELFRNGADGDVEPAEKIYVDIARETDEGFPFRGYVDYGDPEMDIDTGTIRVRAIVDNADKQLIGGLFVRIRLRLGTLSDAIVVPKVSINSDQQGKFIYVIDDDDQVERRAVVLGPVAADGVVVTEGIQAGERIVVAGQLSARPGAKVTPREAPTTED